MASAGNSRCTKCGADNREGAKFCSECATPFAVKCPRCGAADKPAAKFCDECAASLTPASTIPETVQLVRVVAEQAEASALDGERKTVTALFADIKGSTELMEDLDPIRLVAGSEIYRWRRVSGPCDGLPGKSNRNSALAGIRAISAGIRRLIIMTRVGNDKEFSVRYFALDQRCVLG